MATLEQLKERKRELEDKLADGDLSVEPALDQVDRAIAARSRQVRHSRERLAAVKKAVAAGVPLEDTTPERVAARRKKAEREGTRRPLNKFE